MVIREVFGNMKLHGTDKALDIFNMTLMILILIVIGYPFLNVLSLSFSSENYILSGQVNLLPKGFTLSAYKTIINHPSFLGGYLNTIVYTSVQVIISLVLTSLTAYPLSKSDLPGIPFFKKAVMFTMLFSGGMIQMFLLVKALNLYNTVWAVTLPGAVAPFNVMIMMTYFKSLPKELNEASEIDGLGEFGTFLRIVLPLSKPIIATMVLFFMVGQWNNWFGPLIYFSDNDKYPVILLLRNMLFNAQQIATNSNMAEELLKNQESTGEAIKYSTIVLTLAPFMCIYPFMQKYFAQGMMVGSVKG